MSALEEAIGDYLTGSLVHRLSSPVLAQGGLLATALLPNALLQPPPTTETRKKVALVGGRLEVMLGGW